jgi:hypothetical protein
MNEFGMYPGNNDTARRWIAERENASARLELARTRECCALLLSQYDPVFSLGIDRTKLKVLLDFVQHHDPARLRRECESLLPLRPNTAIKEQER